MAAPAVQKRAAADVKAGRSSSPARMTIQVLPQIKHWTRIKSALTIGEGALATPGGLYIRRWPRAPSEAKLEPNEVAARLGAGACARSVRVRPGPDGARP